MRWFFSMNERNKDKILQVYRIHRIDDEIRSGKYPNAAELARLLEVSERTINRDFDVLRDFYNAPMEYSAEHRGWHYTEPNFFIKYIQITEGEFFSLALFDQLLLQYKNTPLEKQLRSIFRKIEGSLPENVSIDSRFLSGDITYIPDALAPIEAEVFDSVIDALKKRRSIIFDYQPLQKTTFMERCLDPYHIICQRGNWYVIGKCHLKNEVRIFCFSRMKNIRQTDELYELPTGFDARDYIDRTMGVWLSARTRHKVRLLFSAEIGTFAAEHIWHENQTSVRNDDGTVEVSFETTQLPEVKRWVLGQGSTVKVLEPQELVDEVTDEAKKLLEMYGRGK